MSRKKTRGKTRTARRLCATCGTPFTWTSRNPRRRFCCSACKARWWRATNADDTTTPSSTTTTPDSPQGPLIDDLTTSGTDDGTQRRPVNAVTQHHDPYVAGYGNGQPPSAVQTCPNCHEPVAVINLLVTTSAAYVNTPSRSVT